MQMVKRLNGDYSGHHYLGQRYPKWASSEKSWPNFCMFKREVPTGAQRQGTEALAGLVNALDHGGFRQSIADLTLIFLSDNHIMSVMIRRKRR